MLLIRDDVVVLFQGRCRRFGIMASKTPWSVWEKGKCPRASANRWLYGFTNHIGISLSNILFKPLAGIILRCLSSAHKSTLDGIKPVSNPVDVVSPIFTIKQVLKYGHNFRRFMVSVVCHLKPAFDSIDCISVTISFSEGDAVGIYFTLPIYVPEQPKSKLW